MNKELKKIAEDILEAKKQIEKVATVFSDYMDGREFSSFEVGGEYIYITENGGYRLGTIKSLNPILLNNGSNIHENSIFQAEARPLIYSLLKEAESRYLKDCTILDVNRVGYILRDSKYNQVFSILGNTTNSPFPHIIVKNGDAVIYKNGEWANKIEPMATIRLGGFDFKQNDSETLEYKGFTVLISDLVSLMSLGVTSFNFKLGVYKILVSKDEVKLLYEFLQEPPLQ